MTGLPTSPCECEPAVPERTKTRLLELLKRHGPQTTQELACGLEITTPAARRHLNDLQEQGLIHAQVEKPGGRGRPQRVYALTDHGEDRAFPKTYAELCVDLLRNVERVYGCQGVMEILRCRNEDLLKTWSAALPPSLPLTERLERLAALLTTLGFAAQLEREGDTWYLVQRNCPNLQVARSFQELCMSEIELYSELLGLPIERESRIVCGQGSCRYRLKLQAIAAPS